MQFLLQLIKFQIIICTPLCFIYLFILYSTFIALIIRAMMTCLVPYIYIRDTALAVLTLVLRYILF